MLSEDVQAGKKTTSSRRRDGEDSFDSKAEVQTVLVHRLFYCAVFIGYFIFVPCS